LARAVVWQEQLFVGERTEFLFIGDDLKVMYNQNNNLYKPESYEDATQHLDRVKDLTQVAEGFR